MAGSSIVPPMQTALLSTILRQAAALSARVVVLEAGVEKTTAQNGVAAQSSDTELEALQRLPPIGRQPFPPAWPSKRYTMIQLGAAMESGATVHGGADAPRAKLAFVEKKVSMGTDGVVTDCILTEGLKEFDTQKTKTVTTASHWQSYFLGGEGSLTIYIKMMEKALKKGPTTFFEDEQDRLNKLIHSDGLSDEKIVSMLDRLKILEGFLTEPEAL
ncbi:hypothetical protein CYMTET_35437 [Cymbomonas tetramitiformis]|uniref:Endoplasmic reticulum resident protein 29 C-terminal domain-containing protein n=1 Tax=Cymbomonas tetramitiformis TaxID=36881 RepID=A0AAE0KNY0_9CHLO|nr:hypothetical protein CYMTET_35437 [Cymbomonas tetramitiformis]